MKRMVRWFACLSIRTKLLVICPGVFLTAILVASLIQHNLVQAMIHRRMQADLTAYTANFVGAIKAIADASIRNYLRGVTQEHYKTLQFLHEQVQTHKLSEEEARSQARELLRSQKIGSTGYVLCIDSQGVGVIHPDPGFIGTDYSDDEVGREVIKRKHGYYEYEWANPDDSAPRPKALYMLYFEPWDWIVAASAYRDEFTQLISIEDIQSEVALMSLAEDCSGYVLDASGKMILSSAPLDRQLIDLDEPTLQQRFRRIRQQPNAQLQFLWQPSSASSQRLVVIGYVPRLDWMVVSVGAMPALTELAAKLAAIDLLAFAPLLLLAYFLVLKVSSSVARPLHEFLNAFAAAESGQLDTRLSIDEHGEMGRLGAAFNSFMGRLQQSRHSLQQSEERYRTIYEKALQGIFQSSLDGRVLEINPAMAHLLGYADPSEFFRAIKQSAHQFYVRPQRRDELFAQVKEQGAVADFQAEVRRKDGSTAWISVTARLARDHADQPTGLEGIVTDITERRRAEEALRRSEELYRSLFEGSRDGIVFVDQKGHILEFNRTYREMLGYASEELYGVDFNDITPAKWHQWERENIIEGQLVDQGYSETYEKEYIHKDGTIFPVELTAYCLPHPHPNGAVYWAVVRDITKRKQAENTLRDSLKMLDDLLEATLSGVLIYNWTPPDGLALLEVNRAAEELTGIKLSDLKGKQFDEIWPQARRLGITDRYLQVMRTGKPYQNEDTSYQDEKLQGCFRVCAFPFTGNRLAVSFESITERKRAESALRNRQAELQQIFDAIPDAVVYIDANHRVQKVNPAFTRLYGYRPSDVTGRTTECLYVNAEDYTHVAGQHYTEKPHDDLSRPSEMLYCRKDGQVFWGETVGTKVVDAQNATIGFIAIVRDVSDRHLAHTEREALINELEAKNAELEQFAYTVSHDLKSPLITVGGYLGVLEEDLADGDLEAVQQDLATVHRAAERMHTLLDDLLQLSRIGRMVDQPERIAMVALAQEALTLVKLDRQGRDVIVDLADDLPDVYGDRPRLVEVMQNLVDNAVKYMGDQAKPRIDIGVRNDPDETVFFVRDNGIGIDPDYHQRVFGLFKQLDPDSAGTGIGLALAKRIIEEHGGRIWVESPGLTAGSTFCFTLPRKPPDPDPS